MFHPWFEAFRFPRIGDSVPSLQNIPKQDVGFLHVSLVLAFMGILALTIDSLRTRQHIRRLDAAHRAVKYSDIHHQAAIVFCEEHGAVISDKYIPALLPSQEAAKELIKARIALGLE